MQEKVLRDLGMAATFDIGEDELGVNVKFAKLPQSLGTMCDDVAQCRTSDGSLLKPNDHAFFADLVGALAAADHRMSWGDARMIVETCWMTYCLLKGLRMNCNVI